MVVGGGGRRWVGGAVVTTQTKWAGAAAAAERLRALGCKGSWSTFPSGSLRLLAGWYVGRGT